ncbi:MAG TPA: hypothetical protein VNU93_02685, partial [Verrucomicrobiae bacterium]|nr:hypothetical protein [Verrucomicrobiae bacterium]
MNELTQRRVPVELPVIFLALILPAAGVTTGVWGSLADIMVILVLSLLVTQRGKQPSLLKTVFLVLGYVLLRNVVRDVLVDMVSIAACAWLGLRNKRTAIIVIIASVAGIVLVLLPKVLENPWALMLPGGKLVLLLGIAHILVVGSVEKWKTGTVLFWAALVGLVYGLAILFSTGPDPITALGTYLKQDFLPETMDFYRQSGVVQ